MHINDILTPQQIKLYLDFFKALDDAEGFHLTTAETMADFDFKNLMFIEKNIREFTSLMDTILPHRDEDIETEGTSIKIIVSEFEDRWKCYDYNCREFYRKERLRSLGAWIDLKRTIEEIALMSVRVNPNEWDPERRMI